MSELKLHATGQNNHLEVLKEKYNSLKDKIKISSLLSDTEKKTEIKNLTKAFRKEKNNTEINHY